MPSIIGDAALLSAFVPLNAYPSMVLAVSGGPDSMALMHLAKRWAALAGRDAATLSVVTVDHGLRPEAKDEAEFVAEWARSLGFPHATLTWTGGKPKSGFQAAARRARYELMGSYCRARGIAGIVTGHTRDDQAETVLMRLRRGSGLDGLSGMATVSELNGLPVLRPLLGLSKARLTAYLRAQSIPFVRDPSNGDVAFERVRLRHAMKACAAAGVTPAALAKAAIRLGRSREALACVTDDFLNRHFCVRSLGQGEIGGEAFDALPDDIALRVLSRVLCLVGGRPEAPRMVRVEGLLQNLRAEKREATLGGCLIIRAGGRLCFYREPGRLKLRAMQLQRDETAVWDGRFELRQALEAAPDCLVKPLGAQGWITYRSAMRKRMCQMALDRLAALTTPAVWKGTTLICAPVLGFINDEFIQPSTQPVIAAMVPSLARFLSRPSGAS